MSSPSSGRRSTSGCASARSATAAVIHVVDSTEGRAGHVNAAASPAGDIGATLRGWADYAGARRPRSRGSRSCARRSPRRAAERAALESDSDPIHPARVYGELRARSIATRS